MFSVYSRRIHSVQRVFDAIIIDGKTSLDCLKSVVSPSIYSWFAAAIDSDFGFSESFQEFSSICIQELGIL